MTRLVPLILPAVLLVACGGGANGPVPNATYFWRVTSSTLEFGQCSDAMDFRADIQPLPFTDNSYIIYKVSKDGKQAVAQSCDRLDVATCKDSTSGVVFAIAGRELTFTRESKDPVGTTGCNLQQTETWTLRDQTKTLEVDIANTLSLVDSPPACDSVEKDLKMRSPNMFGVQGCVVTYKLSAELK